MTDHPRPGLDQALPSSIFHPPFSLLFVLCALCAFAASPLFAQDANNVPILDRPTLHCLGAYWIVKGEDNATVTLEYRKAGTPTWTTGMPLFRVEKGKHLAEKYGSKLDVPGGATLFAGSVVNLEPDTAYELKLTLTGKGVAGATHTLAARTRAEPRVAADAPIRHVIPATGGDKAGDGSERNPFQGLAAAHAAAKPGDVFLLHAGMYAGPFEVTKSGEEGRPIVWRGESAETVILDARGDGPKQASRAISASETHDLYFEDLTIQNADYGIVAHDAARLVVRRCHIRQCDYGLAATRNDKDRNRDFFVADNLIEGPSVWPRSKGIEDARGLQVTGAGHVICYNRIRGFADAIDTFNSSRCEAIDFHNNDISEMTDDGLELDYSTRNVRCFENRFTNVYQGISVQPVFGGPVYAFRNVLYNVVAEPFKMHNRPSGALFVHNTVVKRGPPLLLHTPQPASNLVMRNNLFVGTDGNYAWECSPKMVNCDFDYDGFSAGQFPMFLKWNNVRYATFEDMKAKAPIERHATLVDPAKLFASGAAPPDEPAKQQPTPDLRPSEHSNALDAGEALPGFNDGYGGKGPDLGAYELGAPLPHYGPRTKN